MATPSTKTKSPSTPEQRTLYVRLPARLHDKVRKMAARSTANSGERISLQEIVINLIEAAPQ